MRKIFFRCKISPKMNGESKIYVNTELSRISFKIDNITVCIDKEECNFFLQTTELITNEEFARFEKSEFPVSIKETLDKVNESFRIMMGKILRILTYYYGISHIDEDFLIRSEMQSSINEKDWISESVFSPYEKYKAKWVASSPTYYFPESLASWFPMLIHEDPFVAFEFLHKAMNDDNPKFSWVSATIGAELAFKEFISRFDKRLSFLITSMPSPPLYKLYKGVLNDMTGESSPFVTELRKGNDFRNDIVHDPTTKFTPPLPLKNYLLIVHCAILHLTYLLYPKQSIFKYFYNKAIGELNRVSDKKYSSIE